MNKIYLKNLIDATYSFKISDKEEIFAGALIYPFLQLSILCTEKARGLDNTVKLIKKLISLQDDFDNEKVDKNHVIAGVLENINNNAVVDISSGVVGVECSKEDDKAIFKINNISKHKIPLLLSVSSIHVEKELLDIALKFIEMAYKDEEFGKMEFNEKIANISVSFQEFIKNNSY